MNHSLHCENIGEGILFASIKDGRFKTNRISVHLVTELKQETVTVNALIPQILKDGFQGCETFTKLGRKLEDLYGASIDADVQKRGDRQVLTVSITSIDDRYSLHGEEVNRQTAQILCDMLLHPLVEQEGFSKAYTDLEKKLLADTIDAEINEKRSYAISHMLRHLCANEPYGLPKYGWKERLSAITPQSAYLQYRQLLAEAPIYIQFTGSGEEKTACAVFREAFATVGRRYTENPSTRVHPLSEAPVAELVERMDVGQSKMVLGFGCGFGTGDPRIPAMRLMTAVLGGTPHSKLFLNVREKRSLCYYCVSVMEASKGILLIDCGIEHANIEAARQEILFQLQEMQKGNISQEEIQNALLSLQNSYATIYEYDSAIESFYLGQLLAGRSATPEEESRRLLSVTKEDIQAAANAVKLETVFVLTGKEAS